VVNVSAAKHTGYAVQWFAMAVALVLYALWRSRSLSATGRHPAGRHPAGLDDPGD